MSEGRYRASTDQMCGSAARPSLHRGITVLPASVLLLVAALLFGACAPDSTGADAGSQAAGHNHDAATLHPDVLPVVEPISRDPGEPLRVAATTTIIGALVEEIVRQVGDAVRVDTIIGRGVEVHGFEPAPSDVRLLADADIVFVNGFGLEVTLEPILDSLSAYVVPLAAGLDNPIAGDPHVWMSPRNVAVWINVIVEILGKADPANQTAYAAAGGVLATEVGTLDAEYTTSIGAIPIDDRVLVSDHENLDYAARDYGFTVIGTLIGGTSAAAEPSTRDLTDLARAIDSSNVRAILIDSAASDSMWTLARALVADTERHIAVLPILTASLAPAGQPGDTYVGFARFNLETLVRAMGGE